MLLEDRLWPLQRYKERHLPPGGFFKAILVNDLRQACASADGPGRSLIYNYVKWCETHLPAEAWGSGDNYQSWIAKREGLWRQDL